MVKIVTDSVSQFPQVLAQELDVGIVPFPIIIDGKSFRDGIDIQPEELYHRMRSEEIFPTTSHPSPGEYAAAIRKPLEAGAEAVVFIGMIASLSGAFASAQEGAEIVQKEFPDRRVIAIDSGIVTLAQGFLVLEAAKAAQAGADLETVLKLIEENKPRVGFFATLQTLEYLARGGRIGRAAHLAGTVLRIKPILTVGQDGVVGPVGQALGLSMAYRQVISHVEKAVGHPSYLRIGIMQADAPREATELERLARERLAPDEIIPSTFTPVMAAHTGPGLFGIAYHYK